MTLAARLRAATGTGDAAAGVVRGDWDIPGTGGIAQRGPLTRAAVLIACITHDRPTILLTRRTTTLRRHPGQVAFPGGRIDPEDSDEIAAALREAHEEVALPPAAVDVLGTSDPYVTGTGYHITPVLGMVPPGVPLVPAAAEVDSIFEVPLDFLLDPANRITREGEWQGHKRAYYVFHWQTHEIWGATAAMLVNLAVRLA